MIVPFFVLSCLSAVAFGLTYHQVVPILYSTLDLSPEGSFQWSYGAGDGSSQQQSGQQVPVDVQKVSGRADWIDPQGGTHALEYVADENGYRPQSSDLPVAPPIPPAILRSLHWNAAHPEEERY